MTPGDIRPRRDVQRTGCEPAAGLERLEDRILLSAAPLRDITVHNRSELVAALNDARAGDSIAVAAGNYGGGYFVTDKHGTADAPIVLRALDPANRPVFDFGGAAGDLVQFVRVSHLEIRNLTLQNVSGNGLNISDGGPSNPPSTDIVVDGLQIRDLGSGNNDGIKLSGVDRFTIAGSTIERWGTGGSGIDMVGCHDGVIEGNSFAFVSTAAGNGLEAKGGSRDIAIRDNRFDNAASRAVQIGGSTGLEFFRPAASTVNYEAAEITVERNVIVGGEAAVAFVNSDGGTVRYNTIYRPTNFAFRILQENANPGFTPARNGVVERNIIVFGPSTYQVNDGAGTDPGSFRFAENWWYNADNPSNSKPNLPATEPGAVYGVDPQFVNAAAGDFRTKDGSPAAAYGAYAPVTPAEPAPKLVDMLYGYGADRWVSASKLAGRTAPWQITKIRFVFDRAVLADAADLTVTNAAGARLAFSGFTNDAGTATWTLAVPIETDRLKIELDGDSATADGNAGVSTAGGDLVGGDVALALDVLFGDANGDGKVSVADLLLVRGKARSNDPFADLDGDGRVDVADQQAVRNRAGAALPQ